MKPAVKFILSFSFFLLITPLFAQEAQSKIYLGLQAGPNISYRVLSNNTGESSVDADIDYLNNREEAAFGFRLAAVSGYRFSDNWTLEAGVAYIENCKVLNLNFGDQTDPRRGFVSLESPESIESADLKNCLTYIGVPIRLIRTFGTTKVRIMASMGLTPQVLLDQRTISRRTYKNNETDKSDFENLEEANEFNLSPSLGIGAELKLSDHFFLRAEGIARFGFINVNEDSPINSYLYSSELNIGINYLLPQGK